MKIAMVFSVFNKAGGIERAMVEVSTRLIDDGHDVHLVANDRDSAYRHLPFHYIPMLKPNNPLQMFSFSLASTVALRSWLRKERFDIVHSHGLASLEADVVTAQSCHRAWVNLSNPTLSPFTWPWLRRRLNPQHPTMMWLERHIYAGHHYRKIVAVSEGLKQDIVTWYGVPADDIVVIPNGVDLDEFNVDTVTTERAATRARLGLAPGDCALLFVANEFPRKGLSQVLDALTRLPDTVHLVCIGRGNPAPYLATVERLGLQPRVHFIPNTPDIRGYYAASDMFVLPTQYESFCIAALEAAVAGLPLLCTRVQGIEDRLVDGYNGFFVERDGRDIATKVQWLLDNPDQKRILGEAARESAQGYGWDAIKDQHVALYHEILTAKRHPRSSRSGSVTRRQEVLTQ